MVLRPWWFVLAGSGQLLLPSTYKALWCLPRNWRNAQAFLRHELVVATPPGTPLIVTYIRLGQSVTSQATAAALRQPALLTEHALALQRIDSPLHELNRIAQSVSALAVLLTTGSAYALDVEVFGAHFVRDALVLLAATLLFDAARRIMRYVIRRRLNLA